MSRFPIGRPLHSARSRRRRDFLRLGTYDCCDAQLEFFDGFDWARLVHELPTLTSDRRCIVPLPWHRVQESNLCASLESAAAFPRARFAVIALLQEIQWPTALHRIALELLHVRTGLPRVRVLGVRCLKAVTRF
jgi:hypothetical protein